MPQSDEQPQPEQLEFAFCQRGAVVVALRRKSQQFLKAAQSACTRRAYEGDWRIFERWCAEFGRQCLPASAETVALFLADQSERRSVATVERRAPAIAAKHRAAGAADPTKAVEVVEVLAGLRRTKEAAGLGKAALTVDELFKLVRAAGLAESPRAERDQALLLLGFAGGFRRSELAGLELRDVRVERRGALITLRRSKTDQEGRGRVVAVPRSRKPAHCPVAALERWLVERGRQPGALFCRMGRGGEVTAAGITGQWVWRVVKEAAAAAGLDPAKYGAHSLRAGLVTAAHERGLSDVAIMQTTGHRRVETLAGYVRKAPGRLFAGAAVVGLL